MMLRHKNNFINEHCPYRLAIEKFFNEDNVMTKQEYKLKIIGEDND